MHDFNPGITPNGVFWIVQVPDSAVTITGDTLTIHMENVANVDQFNFPGGTGNVPVTVSFDITYTKIGGTQRQVRPTSRDPLTPFTWAGKMWRATNSGTFSVTYNDLSFSATGSFSSASDDFGEMGTERNGSFVNHEKEDAKEESGQVEQGQMSGTQVGNAEALWNSPRLKGRALLSAFPR